MAITDTAGFDGNLTEAEWARIQRQAGAPYSVGGQGDFAVTPVPAVDRTVSIAAGLAYGHGVEVTNDAAATVQLPTLASGTRYDLICVRRDWTTNTASLTSVQGTSVLQVPSGRMSDPGTGQDDQPLALVQVTAGQQVPTVAADLRVWSSAVMTAGSLLALPDPQIGEHVWVGDTLYRRALNTSGVPAWLVAAARPARVVWENQNRNFTAQSTGAYRLLAQYAIQNAPPGEYSVVGAANMDTTQAGGATGELVLRMNGTGVGIAVGIPQSVRSRHVVTGRHAHAGGSLAVRLESLSSTAYRAGDTNLLITWCGPYPS